MRCHHCSFPCDKGENILEKKHLLERYLLNIFVSYLLTGWTLYSYLSILLAPICFKKFLKKTTRRPRRKSKNLARLAHMVRRGSDSSASACCKAGPSSILGSAPQGGLSCPTELTSNEEMERIPDERLRIIVLCVKFGCSPRIWFASS